MVDLISAQAFGVPLVPHALYERFDESLLVFDEVDNVVSYTQDTVHVVATDGNGSDMRVVGSAVRVQVFVVGLKAVENGLYGIMLRIGKKRAARIDCTRAENAQRRCNCRLGESRGSPCSSIVRTAMCCFSR